MDEKKELSFHARLVEHKQSINWYVAKKHVPIVTVQNHYNLAMRERFVTRAQIAIKKQCETCQVMHTGRITTIQIPYHPFER